MILCGIDSSTRYTAISCFENGRLDRYELIDLHREKDAETRTNEMVKCIYLILDEMMPDVVYQELTWLGNNPKTTIQLTSLLGAVRGWAIYNHADYYQISASKWRKLLEFNNTVERKEQKKQSINYVKEEFEVDPETDDVADAICIGLAGYIIEVNSDLSDT